MNIIEVTLSKNSSKSEPFVFDSIEHILLSYDGDLTSNAVHVVIYLSAFLILITNVSLISMIKKQMTRTFLDQMVLLDLVMCIGNILNLLMFGYRGSEDFVGVCTIQPAYAFFLSLFSRVNSFVIVFYRYIFVMKHHLVDNLVKRKHIEGLLKSGKNFKSHLIILTSNSQTVKRTVCNNRRSYGSYLLQG